LAVVDSAAAKAGQQLVAVLAVAAFESARLWAVPADQMVTVVQHPQAAVVQHPLAVVEQNLLAVVVQDPLAVVVALGSEVVE
jgi:hypothetical protein